MPRPRRATRENLGYLLAKASQRWNELLHAEFVREGFPEVRPSYGSVLIPLFEEVLVVEKRLLLKEEVHVTQRLVETHAPQRVTRRREEVVVERVGPEGSKAPAGAQEHGPGPDEPRAV